MKLKKPLLRFTGVLVIVLVAGLTYSHRFDIQDSWRLRNYKPTTQISHLADETTMLASTRRVFYAQNPEQQSKALFAHSCTSSEQTIVLGCYIANQGIYLLSVDDPRLAGVEEVTAAHETLHAAYDRLSSSERKRVNALLEKQYTTLNNDRIKKNIGQYQKDGADVVNEMHSILGTEVQDLSPELEAYYARYFSNRKAIVAFSDKYEEAFTSRKELVTSYDKQLGSLKDSIDQKQTDLESLQRALTDERTQLDTLAKTNQIAAYNTGVDSFNAKVRDYNAGVGQLKSLITKYNDLVTTRNAVALETQSLVESINSHPATQSEQ